LIDPDPSTHHLHFFFDDVAPQNAGTNGNPPGKWVIWDVPSPFTGMKVADRPADANRICVLVANSNHEIELDTGNCVDIPAC